MDSIQKKIILDECGERILDEYCVDEMKKIRKICDPIIFEKGVPQMYHDDLYSIALDTLINSVERYDKSRECSFKTFLTGNIKRTFYDWTRDTRRFKRCNTRKDENGEIVIIPDVFIDAPTEDGIDLCEKIPSDFRIEDEVSEEIGFSKDDKIEKYLSKLSIKQRKIVMLLSEGYKPLEIQEILQISKESYLDNMKAIQSYDNIKILM